MSIFKRAKQEAAEKCHVKADSSPLRLRKGGHSARNALRSAARFTLLAGLVGCSASSYGSGEGVAAGKMEVDCHRAGYFMGSEPDEAFRSTITSIQAGKLASTYGVDGKVPAQCVSYLREGVSAGMYAQGYAIPASDKTAFTDAMELCFEAGWRIERIKLRNLNNFTKYHATLDALDATPYRSHNVCALIWAQGREQGAAEFKRGE